MLFKNALKRGQGQLGFLEGSDSDNNIRPGNNRDLMYRLEDDRKENRVELFKENELFVERPS